MQASKIFCNNSNTVIKILYGCYFCLIKLKDTRFESITNQLRVLEKMVDFEI